MSSAPVTVRRAVVVSRPTVLDELIAQHGTRGQAAFVLRTRGQDIAGAEEAHAAHAAAMHEVAGAIPLAWRRAHVHRQDLDRFLFEPDDVVVVVGPDGLVANVAKYLDGQPVIGVDAGDGRSVGQLTRTAPQVVGPLLVHLDSGGELPIEQRTMVEAVLDDGRTLRALNEVFVGHRSHQSARYRLAVGERHEAQSSSGLIVCSGTGGTGWASSIHAATGCLLPLPAATAPDLLLLVREAWPSPTTGADLVAGTVTADQPCTVRSAMDGGTVFGDGIETDPLPFDHGRSVTVRPAQQGLQLVVA